MDVFFLNVFLFLVFPMMLLYKSRFQLTALDNSMISVADSNVLRGIAAVFVMIAHYILEIQGSSNLEIGSAKLFSWFGGLGVCLFFFLSGYGMQIRYAHEKLNLSFLARRFIRIYPSYIVLRFLFGWIQMIDNKLSTFKCLLYILGIYKPMWFIVEILLIYVLYYIASRFLNEHINICMTVMLIVMSALFYVNDFEAHWYNANLLFVIGAICAKYWSKITKFYFRAFIRKIILTGIFFAIFSLLFTTYKGTLYGNCFKVFAGAMFCLLFVQMNMAIRWNSRMFSMLGNASLELYIVHQNIWRIYEKYIPSEFISVRFIICSVCAACIALLYKYCLGQLTLKQRSRRRRDEKHS